ncbi:hypothetical protein [Spirosoma arcticum]
MAQLSNQAGSSTDAYSTTPSTAAPKTGLTNNPRKMGAIAAATVLLGGAVGLVIARPKDGDPSGPVTDENSSPVTKQPIGTMPEDIDVAGKVIDSMSFEQAFGAARDEVGMGGVFSWHGRWYNTFEKEEWTGLSLEQRQEYTEMITGEKLPVKPYHSLKPAPKGSTTSEKTQPDPTMIEGYLNGRRVMGLDYDRDGVIDTLVMDGPDGQTYRVVDASGDQGLDTVYRYDSLDGQLTGAVILDHPVMLSNDDFSQGLEASMSKEVVNSILESDEPTPAAPTEMDETGDLEPDDTLYLATSSEPDDTYINNGNVRDMDE